jgi:glucose/arabinose dehydrogenase
MLALALAGALPPGAALAQTVADPLLQVASYACCPEFPTSFAFLPAAPGGPVDLLVLEKFSGRVQRFRDAVLQGTALDLAVSNFGERGLLGIALHPDFASNGYVYLYYTASPDSLDAPSSSVVLDNRIVRYTWNGSTLDSPHLVLRLPARPGFVHLGGVIVFGPDGMLYGIIGNLNRFGQLQNDADGAPPDTTSIVFRVQDDGTPPADNPFYAMGGAMQFVYGYGVRNSFGIEFDPVSGVLWETENGTTVYDEVNRFQPGFNSGFVEILGPAARDPQGTATLWVAPGSHYSDPQFSWLDQPAPTAIHFLRSDSLGTHNRHDAFVGSYNDRAVYHFELDAARGTLVMPEASVADRVADSDAERDLFLWASGFGGGIVDIDTGPDGAMYLLSFDDNRVYRIGRVPLSDAGSSGGSLPHRLAVSPNPFRTSASLGVHGSPAEVAALRIYTVSGRLVRVLEGRGPFTWDGADQEGRPVAQGTYVARLRSADGQVELQSKIVRLR